ncbi:MAG: pcaC 2 [Actinomycetia bacterium]|nr:pcaC 2 [Actinomycetes bacterium]
MARIDLPEGDGLDIFKAFALRPDLAAGANAYDQAVWNSTLDWRLHELVRMRIAQANQCTVCLGWRTPQALEAGITEELLAAVASPSEAAGFTPAEVVALEFTAQYATDSSAISDELMGRLKQHFDSGEIVELTLVLGKYLALGKFMQVLGLDQACDLQSALATSSTSSA